MRAFLIRLSVGGMTLGMCLIAACSASGGGGGGGASVSFTIGGKTFTFGFDGNQGIFRVQAGGEAQMSAVRVDSLFGGQTPTDQPAVGEFRLASSDVQVTTLSTEKAIGPMQPVTGNFEVRVLAAGGSEEFPCSEGTEVGTFHVRATETGVTIDESGLTLPANVLNAVRAGTFSLCLQVTGDANATVTISRMGVAFEETEAPGDNENESPPDGGNENEAPPAGNENEDDQPPANDNEGDEPDPSNLAPFSEPVEYTLPLEVSPYRLAVADFDEDMYLDVAIGGFFSNDSTFATFHNSGDGTLSNMEIHDVGDGYSSELVAGDFDNDGHADVAFINNYFHGIEIWFGDGTGALGAVHEIETGHNRLPSSITVGDFNGDGLDDLATCHKYDDELTILLNQGSGNFLNADMLPIYDTGSLPTYLSNADFDRDGDFDILVLNTGDAGAATTLGLFENTGDGTFSNQIVIDELGTFPDHFVITDTDGDNDLDILLIGGAVGGGPGPNGLWPNVSVLVGSGTGLFSVPLVSYPGATIFERGAVGDIDLDGDMDLAAVSGTRVSIALNTGAGVFSETIYVYEVAPNALWVALADMDRDGDLDVVVTSGSQFLGGTDQQGAVSVLFNEAIP